VLAIIGVERMKGFELEGSSEGGRRSHWQEGMMKKRKLKVGELGK